MPSKKKKYNARFPAGRIKKIMQSDEEVGKVAQAVPVIISRTLELFVESLLTKTLRVTNARNAKTLSPSHMKQCIMAETQFDFLRELVKNVPDISVNEEYGNYNEGSIPASPYMESPPPSVTTPITPLTPMTPVQQEPYDLSRPSTSCDYNYVAKNFNISSPPQKYPQKPFPLLNMGMSNGGQTNIGNSSIRNGNNNLSGDIISNNQTRSSISSPSSSSTSSQGIEIVCKNSLIAKISIPSISPSNESNLSNKLIAQTPPPQEVSPNIRTELKRPWDSMTRLRYPMQPQQPPNSTVTTGAASISELFSSPASSITIDSGPSPSKLSRLHSINQENQKQNITITPISLQNQGVMRHNYNDFKNSKELSNLSSLVTGAPVVKYEKDDTKPIINLDYSNIQLLQCHDRKTNANNYFQSQQSSSSSFSQQTIKTNSLKNNGTSQQSIQASDITNNPIINIDLSNIATQPPTININFNNLIKPTENNRSTTNTVKNPKITSSLCTPPSTSAITAAAVASIIPSTAAQLDLDEDYDNI